MRTVTGTDFSSNAAEKYFNSFRLYGFLNIFRGSAHYTITRVKMAYAIKVNKWRYRYV